MLMLFILIKFYPTMYDVASGSDIHFCKVAFQYISMRCGRALNGEEKTHVDLFVGHIPLFYKKVIKDQI